MPKNEKNIEPINEGIGDVSESIAKQPLSTTNLPIKNNRIDDFSNGMGTIQIQSGSQVTRNE